MVWILERNRNKDRGERDVTPTVRDDRGGERERETISTVRRTQARETIQREREEPRLEMTRRELVRTTKEEAILGIFRFGERSVPCVHHERGHKWDAERGARE